MATGTLTTLECEAAYSNPCKRHAAWEAGPGSHSYTRLQCPKKPPPGSHFSCTYPSPHILTAPAGAWIFPPDWGRRAGHPKPTAQTPLSAHPVGVQLQVPHGLSCREDLELFDDVHRGAHAHRLVHPAVTCDKDIAQALWRACRPCPLDPQPACSGHAPVPRKRTS